MITNITANIGNTPNITNANAKAGSTTCSISIEMKTTQHREPVHRAWLYLRAKLATARGTVFQCLLLATARRAGLIEPLHTDVLEANYALRVVRLQSDCAFVENAGEASPALWSAGCSQSTATLSLTLTVTCLSLTMMW